METSQFKRGAIIALHNEGMSKSEIARRIGVSKPTVTLWVRRYETTGATDNYPRSGRPRCTTSEEDQAIVTAKLGDPFESVVNIRNDLGLRCSTQTVRNRRRYAKKKRGRKQAQKPELPNLNIEEIEERMAFQCKEDCDEFSSLNDVSSPARKRLREDTAMCSARLSPATDGSSCLDEVTVKTELIDTYVGICSEENPDHYSARLSPAIDGSLCLDKATVKTEPIFVDCSSEKPDQVTAKEELEYKEEELIPDFSMEVENGRVPPTDVCRDQVIDPLGVSSVEIPHSSSTKRKEPWQYTHRPSKQTSRHIQPNTQDVFRSKAASVEHLNTQAPVIYKVQENSMSQQFQTANYSSKDVNRDEILNEIRRLMEDSEEDNLMVDEQYDSEEGEVYIPSIPSDDESDSEEGDNPRPSTSTTTPSRERCYSTTTAATSPATSASDDTAAAATTPASTALVTFSKTSLLGHNDHQWSATPAVRGTAAMLSRNIVTEGRPGPQGQATLADTPEKCLELFLDEKMILEIVTHTNALISALLTKISKKTAIIEETSIGEIKALIGILIFSGCRRDNHLPMSEMWHQQVGTPLYRAAMSEKRFCFLLRCLRFDNAATRSERKETDGLAPIRNIWDEFVSKCHTHYIPGDALTIDEQLLAFRGRCSFRMYMPNKSAKYGLKLLTMCDVDTKYMLNAIPYLGKQSSTLQASKGLHLGHYFTKELAKPYLCSGRNITTNNWFTSVQLSVDMLTNCGLNTVGMLRSNKPEIPPEMSTKMGRQAGSSAFCFDNGMTMVSYLPQTKKKHIILLSTMHSQPTIDANGKPEIINYHNKTKGAVDTFDRMCSMYTCSRKTMRWPLCLFFGILDAATINAWIIHSKNREGQQVKRQERRLFMRDLALQLVTPWAQKRLNTPSLNRDIKQVIATLLRVNTLMPTIAPPLTVKKKCVLCTKKEDRKTKNMCNICRQPVCGVHSCNVCINCV